MSTQLPNDVPGLLALLEKTYPLKTFPATATAVEMHRHFGARDVIDWLRIVQKEAIEGHYADDSED